ncbi:MAG: ABC transporter permease [Enterocloster asparagiformis]|nr:ABC transporter permease [Enterocloster asparagiformis]
MKSYLSLIPISAKVRRRQNRMTILCIIISVLLVTTVFSIADMMIRTQRGLMLEKHGSWHISLKHVSQDIAAKISRRPDVTAVGWSEVFNSDFGQPYYIGEKKAALYGADKTYMTQIAGGVSEGNYPQSNGEIMLTGNAKNAIGAQIGAHLTLHTPAGATEFTVSGFGSDDENYYQGQLYAVGVTMTPEAFAAIMEQNRISGNAPTCYVQFQNAGKAAGALSALKEQYHLSEDTISENTAVMGIAGKSNNENMKNFYGIAAVLFFLVLLAGVLMISGSMNSNLAQRAQFFGIMRCIGASRGQIIRLVRLEALNWCRTAVPIGVILGTAISWAICALLHYGIGGEFSTTPVFKISSTGIVCGIAVGIVTVLLAAQAPARRAARVSPIAAVSGSAENHRAVRRAARDRGIKIEWTLGIHHATSTKKNWILMTASFSLSIIMFLSFSVGMDFARALLPSLRPWQPDVSLGGYANALVLNRSLAGEIDALPGVARVWGSSYMDHIPVTSSRPSVNHVNLVSYDDYMMECAKKSVAQGNISDVTGDRNQVMTIYNRENPLRVGDTIRLGGTEIEIACALSDGLFSSELIVICPQDTFDRLVGEQKYNLIGVQLNQDATGQTVKQISSLATGEIIFSDMRESNQETASTYFATRVVGYSFLGIIGMITIFNMINSISMSASARIKQYGAMRAVGMDAGQLTRMIFAETFTYAISGLTVGLGIGVPLSRFLYGQLITRYFGCAWSAPAVLLVIVVVFVLASALAAVYGPAKRMRNMAIAETINEL